MGIKADNKRLYKIWQGMRQRCQNPNDKDYDSYGGRGITVYEDWNNSKTFIEWAKENGYKDDLSIDRIDVNGNYEPSNCRWATQTQQVRNRRILRNNKTGHNGIHYDRGYYRATIYRGNKRISLGTYKTLEEAIEARKQGEKVYW